MVPNVTKSGTSFKGAMSYYLHDKRQEGEAQRWTTERVAWTATRNMATDDPAVAMRVMIATAQRADDLKAAAGIAATGRKSAKSVYAYSLSWHPDEAGKIDRAEMMKAAESSLIALGAEGHQAVIVAHQDEPHPHVHVILNRVHPDTGKLFVASNDFRTLDRWALAYREARGEELKYCPKRAENREQARQKAEAAPKAPERPAQREPSRGAVLAALQADMKARHRQEWKDAGAAYKARREQVWQDRPSFKAIAAQHRADTRPLWSAIGKEEWRERKAFQAREQSLGGIIRNAMAAVTAKGIDAGRGHLRAIASHVFNGGERVAVFEQGRAALKDGLRRELREQLDGKIAAAKANHAARLAHLRAEYDAAREALKSRQDIERAQIRDGWRALYAERDQAQPLRGRSWSRRPTTRQRENPAMRDFDEARQKRMVAANITRQPTAPVPAPQPNPMGAAPAPSQRQDVPKVDRAADFAKTPEGAKVVARQAPKAAPDNLRNQAPDAYRPQTAAPARETRPESPNRDIWNKATTPPSQQADDKKQQMRDIWSGAAKPKPSPDRRRDRDNDLEPEL